MPESWKIYGKVTEIAIIVTVFGMVPKGLEKRLIEESRPPRPQHFLDQLEYLEES